MKANIFKVGIRIEELITFQEMLTYPRKRNIMESKVPAGIGDMLGHAKPLDVPSDLADH